MDMKRGLLVAATLLSPGVGHAGARQVQSLDGTWQIVFDHGNVGRDNGWFRKAGFPDDKGRDIAVPSCWELSEKDYEGVAFYRRAFRVPAEWTGQVVHLPARREFYRQGR